MYSDAPLLNITRQVIFKCRSRAIQAIELEWDEAHNWKGKTEQYRQTLSERHSLEVEIAGTERAHVNRLPCGLRVGWWTHIGSLE